MISRLPNPTPDAKKVLILAHRRELLFQPFNYFERYFPDLKVGLELGSKKAGFDADVILARSLS